MSHFVVYNTDDPNAEKEGWKEFPSSGEEGHELTLGPGQTDRAQKIGGSVYSEKAGEILIQQSFDGVHWDIQTKTSVAAETGLKIFEDIVAPQWRLVFINTTASKIKHLRIFARSWISGD
jgi:hypothetical protein